MRNIKHSKQTGWNVVDMQVEMGSVASGNNRQALRGPHYARRAESVKLKRMSKSFE